jgi:hypothetical protein
MHVPPTDLSDADPYLDVVAEPNDDHAADRVVDLIIALHAATPAVQQINILITSV